MITAQDFGKTVHVGTDIVDNEGKTVMVASYHPHFDHNHPTEEMVVTVIHLQTRTVYAGITGDWTWDDMEYQLPALDPFHPKPFPQTD